MTEAANHVAQPGDPDLDCDLTGVLVQSVLRLDGDFVVILSEGSGHWRSASTGEMTVIDHVTHMEFHFGWAYMPDRILDAITHRLDTWAKNRTRLQLVTSPTKLGQLRDGQTTVPIPRSPPI